MRRRPNASAALTLGDGGARVRGVGVLNGCVRERAVTRANTILRTRGAEGRTSLPEFTQPVGGGFMPLTAALRRVSGRQHLVYFLFPILQMRRQDRKRERDLSTVTRCVNCRLTPPGSLSSGLSSSTPPPSWAAANPAGRLKAYP